MAHSLQPFKRKRYSRYNHILFIIYFLLSLFQIGKGVPTRYQSTADVSSDEDSSDAVSPLSNYFFTNTGKIMNERERQIQWKYS